MGHSPESVWGYTPRRLKAFLQIADRRKRHEAAEQMSLQSMATRGEGKALQTKVRELTKD